VLGTSRRASRSGQRGAGTRCCKASEPLGVNRCRVAGEPAWSNNEEQSSRNDGAHSGGTHLGLRRPPHPSRGEAEQKTSAVGASRSRGTSHPVRAGNAEGAQPSFSRATLTRQRGARLVQGGDSRLERNADLHSGLPVHGARASSDACGSRGSLLASTRKSGQRANVGEELRRPSSRSRIRRPAVGARASSYCRSR
jgi:hypothetical protein